MLGTVNVIQTFQHLRRSFIAERIINRLRIAAIIHKTVAAQTRQMLRQRRLRKSNDLLELADILLALIKSANNHQALFVRQRLQEVYSNLDIFFDIMDVHTYPYNSP